MAVEQEAMLIILLVVVVPILLGATPA
jgi:hypothetical protein